MQIDQQVYDLLNTLLTVILWTLIISAPAILLTLEMYGYEKFKKYKYKEVAEKEKIILGKANQITKQDEELERQAHERKKLTQEIELLEQRRKALKKMDHDPATDPEDTDPEDTDPEDTDPEDTDPEDTPNMDELLKKDLDEMNIREMKKLAKYKGLTMYSKKNKKQLKKMLKNTV